MKLNLEARNKMETMIKSYLESNVSEILARKINEGTPFTKEGKSFINKKTMKGFINFATTEAQKITEKGERGTFIDNDTVYGWAIHYFEENSIEGELYTLDGQKYELSKPNYIHKPVVAQSVKKPEVKPQLSIFDMMKEEEEKENVTENDEPTSEDIKEAMETLDDEIFDDIPKKKPNALYQKYLDVQSKYPDCIVVYRLGDFYEVLGDNSKIIADKLDLTLTGRECGLDERIPMVGFPYHIADEYIDKMVNYGLKLAVVDNPDNIWIASKETKHWIDENKYVDKDGVIHEETKSSMNSVIFNSWKNILGDILK